MTKTRSPRTMSITTALNTALSQAMAQNARIIMVGEDISGGGNFGVTEGLHARFGPGRVIDTPISEAGFLSMALGSAMTGLRPVVEIMFNDFAPAAFDVFVNQMAKLPWLAGAPCPLTVRMAYGAGDRSGPHHSQSLYHLFAGIPGLEVLAPATPADAAGLLSGALAADHPTILFEHKNLYNRTGDVVEPVAQIKPGLAVRRHDGGDVSILAAGLMAAYADEAGALLAGAGIAADIIDLRSINPLDEAIVLDSVNRTGRVLIADEGPPTFGLTDRLAGLIARRCPDALAVPVATLTPPATPTPYSPELEDAWLPAVDDIVALAKRLMEQ